MRLSGSINVSSLSGGLKPMLDAAGSVWLAKDVVLMQGAVLTGLGGRD